MKTKNLLLAVAAAAVLTGCEEPELPEKRILLNKEYSYYKSTRNGEWELNNRFEYKYDLEGRLTESKEIAPKEDSEIVVSKETRQYDNIGNETSYERIEYDASTGSVSGRILMTYQNYDVFGNCGKETTFRYDAPFKEPSEIEIILCEFDRNGRKTKETTADDVVTYEYFENGNLKTKYFADIVEGEVVPSRKIEYSYYGNTKLQLAVETYYFEDEAYATSPSDRHYFEYDENGFQTLYAIYENGVLDSSIERVMTSPVSYKETMRCTMPDVGYALSNVTEKTFLNHKSMINDDFQCLLTQTEYTYDLYVSNLPIQKTSVTYTFANGVATESLMENIRYEYNSQKENSYYANKSVYEYN